MRDHALMQNLRRGQYELDVARAVESEIHQAKITAVTVYHGDTYQFDDLRASPTSAASTSGRSCMREVA